MDALTAILICALAYAAGDFVSHKTKATMPMLFVSGFILLLGFWTVLPPTLLEDTGLFAISAVLAPVFVIHTGTLLNLREMFSEYRTVIISLSAVLALASLLYFLGSALIGEQFAVAAAGPISGGLVAVLIIQEAAATAGLEQIAVFVTVLFVLQLFVGLPIAALCLSVDATRRLARIRENKHQVANAATTGSKASSFSLRIFPELPAHYKTPFILLCKVLMIAWLALWVSELLNGAINKFIIALIFGVLFREIGFLEEKILDHANASGFILFALFVLIYWYLPKATPEVIASLIWPVAGAFVIALIAIALVSALMARLFDYSWYLCVALSICCFFGFPGTYIVPQEVAKVQAENEEENEMLVNFYLPKMLVAGFTSVSVASVLIAGFMAKLLV
ncbi:MAG: hypothetical protein AB8B48_11280 [Pseudomonadales bacterium]